MILRIDIEVTDEVELRAVERWWRMQYPRPGAIAIGMACVTGTVLSLAPNPKPVQQPLPEA